MKKRTIGILATSVALCALVAATTDASAFNKGGGIRSGGGIRAGGIRGFSLHSGAIRGFSLHSGSIRGFSSHGLVSHHFSRHTTHALGNVGQIGTLHSLATNHNALTIRNQLTHNQLAPDQFTHNQFAAQNFRGLYDFNHTGFNRNAFGDPREWHHWGGHFWGAGWNNWGAGWGYWAGPVFWPFLLGDIFAFAFWPYGYYDPFWAYGPAFFLASIFAPGPYFGPAYGYGPDYYGYGDSSNIYYGNAADRQALAQTNAQAMQSCGGLAPGVTDLPVAQIRRTLHPTADQTAALDELNAALAKASETVAASCPKNVPLTPVGRLDAAEKRLDATITAVQVVRSPLEKFYDSLSDEQKERFDAMGRTGRAGPSGGNLAALCGEQQGSVANLPIQRIEQVVEPNEQQQDAFNALKQASESAAQELQASCPTAMPQTPVARLDAAEARLKAMVSAMNTVRPKLEAFYASLSDEQKARFDTMGPPQTTASEHERSAR
ncbi:MAG TPA: Spy/CpxP family protein refolding chaperone [Xanthobacteraceae bacterium]|nr:Spy/CpxP family protein refolding chaperone [Xanthobacteraceae bacterium]